MSKMGISVVSSYRGGYNFEAIGLSRALVAEFFPGMQSRISGIGIPGIARNVMELHKDRLGRGRGDQPSGRRPLQAAPVNGEAHAFEGSLIHTLQTAVSNESFQTYMRYSDAIRRQPPIALRDLLDFKPRPPRRSRWTRSRASPRSASA